MPLYEYNCSQCERDFELLVRGSEEPTCPQCGGKRLDRKFSVPAAHTSGGAGPALPMAGCGRHQCGSGGCGHGH